MKRKFAVSDGDGSGRTTIPRKFPQHSVIDELSDGSNQIVPDTSCVSGHSYSDHVHPAGAAQNHLSTFGTTPPSMLQLRRMYGHYPATARTGSTSLTDVTDADSPDYGGFVVTPVGCSGTATLPSWSAERRQQQVPTVRYASTACVDALRHGADPPRLQSPSSPSTNRRQGPPVLRKPAHDSACRLLGNDDTDCWGADTTTTVDDTAYSCADVSAALRDVETPSSVRQPQRAADISASSTVVNPHQLCDEIDELFFTT